VNALKARLLSMRAEEGGAGWPNEVTSPAARGKSQPAHAVDSASLFPHCYLQ
jgi:hypothetical protein